MKMPFEADLPDINVWLALSAEDHPHHSAAKRYWEDESPSRVLFCRITMLAFLRLTTNMHVMAGKPLAATAAWSLYRQFLAEPGVEFAQEPPGTEARFEQLSDRKDFPQSAWTDAYLAAFALSGGFRVISFDRGFKQYPNLDLLERAV